MKYPIGYNSETRTCQFIEEFNSGASFRMWMDRGKTHVEVFTPDMKRRKEKDFAPHVKSLNEYVSKMYARFNCYKPKGISAAFYINCFGDKYLRSVDLKYVKSINIAALRIGQLDFDKKDELDSPLSRVLGNYQNKPNVINPNVLKRSFQRLSDATKAMLDVGKSLRTFSLVDEINEIRTHIQEISRNRQMLIDALVWNYKVLNGLLEEKTVEVTQASNGRLSVILVNGEAIVVYNLYSLIENDFIINSLVVKDKYPAILQEYKDWLVSADYDELLSQMNKTPYSDPRQEIFDLMENKDAPKHLFRHESLFAKDGYIPRLGNPLLDQSPITAKNVISEMNSLFEESKNKGPLGKRKSIKD